MPIYAYTARDSKGGAVQGEVDAGDQFLAVTVLQGRGLIVTQVTEKSALSRDVTRHQKRRHKGVRPSDLLFAMRQLALLLDAGIPLIRCFEVISEQVESARLAAVLEEIKSSIKAGSTLKDAMTRYPKIFPDFWRYVIEAGESSGNLPLVLNHLSAHLEMNAKLQQKLVSALIYPAILVVVAICAMLVFLLKLIPVFAKMFADFNAPLPPLTIVVISISKFVQDYFLFMAAGFVILFYLFKRYASTPGGRRRVDTILLKLPVLGTITNDILHARVNMIFSTLIKSGLNMLKSIEISANVAGNVVFQEALANVGEGVKRGVSLSACLGQNPIFSSMMVQLVKIGEESGRLADMVEKSADYYESRVDVFMSRLGTIIEPLVLIFIGAIIGTLVISMFLPLFQLSKVVG